jgi:uncharacterized membrane protein
MTLIAALKIVTATLVVVGVVVSFLDIKYARNRLGSIIGDENDMQKRERATNHATKWLLSIDHCSV